MFGAGHVATFMGLPACDDLDDPAHRVVLIGAGACTSYANVGAYCAGGPAAIRQGGAQYAASLGNMNFDLGLTVTPAEGGIADAGDLPQVDGEGAANRARIAGAVGQLLARGAVPVLIGGDDSIPIPMIEAFGARPGGRKVTILQIDAHIDWRDVVQGERLGLSSTMRRSSEMAHVERIVQVGQRGFGSARREEIEIARAWGAEIVRAAVVHEQGIEAALRHIPEGSDILVTFDCDALDNGAMPAVVIASPGGLTYAQVAGLVTGAAAKGRIVGFDMMEFVPGKDRDGTATFTAASLLAHVVGTLANAAG